MNDGRTSKRVHAGEEWGSVAVGFDPNGPFHEYGCAWRLPNRDKKKEAQRICGREASMISSGGGNRLGGDNYDKARKGSSRARGCEVAARKTA